MSEQAKQLVAVTRQPALHAGVGLVHRLYLNQQIG